MNRWKILAILLLFCCISLACFWGVAKYQLAQSESVIEEYVKVKLKAQHYQEGEYARPDIKDAPEGSHPLIHVEGRVRYPGRPAAAVDSTATLPTIPGAATSSAVADIPRGNPCNLEELDVEIGCTVDAMAEPGKPFARMLASGKIAGWGQERILPEQAAGEIHLQVTPSVKPKTWGVGFLAGVSIGDRLGVEFGPQWTGKKRLGGYILAEWQPATGGTAYDAYRETTYATGQPATWRIHGGVSLRLK